MPRFSWSVNCVSALLVLSAVPALAQESADSDPPTATQAPEVGVARRDPDALPIPRLARYTTTDSLGRTITLYVSDPPAPAESGAAPPDLPIALFVQGSGCQSCFLDREGRIVVGNGIGPIFRDFRDSCRLVFVEKPGVAYLDQPSRPGGVDGASREFLEEHTLDRWATAILASLNAALRLPGVDPSRVLVFGHSEGGLVACRVAAMSDRVTHVANLAGGGTTQLYDLIALARRGEFYQHVSQDDPEARVAALLRDWDQVLADPMSVDKQFLGHPNRRWSTFLASSPMEELHDTDARVFLAQGTADTAVAVESFDALYAWLAAHGRDVTARRINGADHSFSTPEEQPGAGWTGVMLAVRDWFIAP